MPFFFVGMYWILWNFLKLWAHFLLKTCLCFREFIYIISFKIEKKKLSPSIGTKMYSQSLVLQFWGAWNWAYLTFHVALPTSPFKKTFALILTVSLDYSALLFLSLVKQHVCWGGGHGVVLFCFPVCNSSLGRLYLADRFFRTAGASCSL